MSALKEGDTVRCTAGDIARNEHAGAIGTVEGFARFSVYHSREVWVQFGEGIGAWFWERDVVSFPERPL